MTGRIAIVGASGLVGATLIERAISRRLENVVPIIHTSGNAWRLMRWGIAPVIADLLDKRNLADALRGSTHVVNCTRGGDEVMLTGLSNLIEVSKTLKITGLVHLSSVMVYGDPPAGNSETEHGDTRPATGTYGWIKLRQDEMIQRAAAAGLPCAILCPPNITGPYSAFLLGLLDAIRADRFALVDGGEAICNVVDVHNLCHAIDLALEHCTHQAQRYFITDDEPVSWHDVVAPLVNLAERSSPMREISSEALIQLRDAERIAPKGSVKKSLRHLVSSEVRGALRKDPLLSKADTWMRRTVAKMGVKIEDSLRRSIEGPDKIAITIDETPLMVSLCAQQLRGIRHSSALAKDVLGYRPECSFATSMDAFDRWYRSHMGMDTDAWPLLRYLVQST